MAKRENGLLVELAYAPWWLSLVAMVLTGLGLRFGPLYLARDTPVMQPAAELWSSMWWMCLVFLAPMLVSLARRARKRKMFERTSRIESIRGLSWKEFEELLGEAYRRTGFRVQENPGKGPDGGIDLVITRGNQRYLVQAKQWRTYKVGVKVVREMLGLVVSENAAGAIIVTSGEFTAEAKTFAKANPSVQLVAGDQLMHMIETIQTGRTVPIAGVTELQAAHTADRSPAIPMLQPDREIRIARTCPSCGGALVSRIARKGPRAGQSFWGCSNYPTCRHTE